MISPLAFLTGEKLINFLTPLWLVGVGVSVGLLLVLLAWVFMWLASRISFLSKLAESRYSYLIVSLLTLVFMLVTGVVSFYKLATVDTFSGDDGLWNLFQYMLVMLFLLVMMWFVFLGLIRMISRRSVDEIFGTISEGVLWYLGLICFLLVVQTAITTFFVPQWNELIVSAVRSLTSGSQEEYVNLPAGDSELNIKALSGEVRMKLAGSVPLLVSPAPFGKVQKDILLQVPGLSGNETAEDMAWTSLSQLIPNKMQYVDTIHVRAEETATIEFIKDIQPVHPQARTIPIAALAVLVVFLLYLFQHALVPKLSAIALATFKSEIGQPFFMIIMGLGGFALLLYVVLPTFTLGDDIKMAKDAGMELIKVLAIIQALWAASTSVAAEIEGRTALIVLSKPLHRRDFILGKFAGIAWTLFLLFVVLGLIMLIGISMKTIYDARENSQLVPTWQVIHQEMIHIVPGLLLSFMEALIIASISIAISTRLPMLANFVICFTIYALGHLTTTIVNSTLGEFQPVVFVAQLIATILPVLDHFSVQAAIATGVAIPLEYLAWASLYCFLYCTVAMLMALVFFEDRDLA